MTLPSTSVEPKLPRAIGPLSSAVIDTLQRVRPALHARPIDVPLCEADPYGLDLQLALYVCYELHYRGFAGVNPRWEWNPALLHVRGRLEDAFLSAVRHDVGEIDPTRRPPTRWTRCRSNRSTAPARRTTCATPGTWEQMREYFVHRSLYHLKEGDPHAFAIPRLDRAGQGVVRRRRVRRVRRRPRRQGASATVRRLDGRRRPRLDLPRLPRRRARRRAGVGQPDVAVRSAPRTARRGDRPFRVDGDHVVAGFTPAGRCAGADGRTRAVHRVSTASTSRPTPSTSRWCAPTSSGISLRANHIWTATWYSASGHATSSRTASPRT